ncbi:hypothetical protein BDP27DRAFT_1214922 [Rhodocollybia butyracea]|uniref:Uncharacterized protein n=1 Tax=Rhodocollybia butyracea TaxID=206335 RepID=A0A9P5UCA9_9AGAR|nr:hypothetical protein BDP27DRAFT_1214922 [Rhodocollybia butyracea]
MFLATNTVVSSQSQAAVNHSIDDGFGDSVTGQKPVFFPMDGWDVWKNETCPPSICFLLPPTSSAFDKTYTQTTAHSGGFGPITITFDFTGIALYIFFILSNNNTGGIISGTSANFTLDGSLVGSFTHEPNPDTLEFQFNVLAFSTTDIENITHEMMIISSALGNDPSAESFLLIFDYALYT